MAMKIYFDSLTNANPNREVKAENGLEKNLNLEAEAGIPEGATYHEQLLGRGKPNQHPITSIIGLQEQLDKLREFAETRGESAYEIAVRNGFVGTESEWLDSLKGEQGISGSDAPRLQIESTRGNMFKHNAVSTILRVVIYYGSRVIRTQSDLIASFGPSARLQWHWQRMGLDDYHVVSANDVRLSDDGFTFGITPEDVDVKITFKCELIV